MNWLSLLCQIAPRGGWMGVSLDLTSKVDTKTINLYVWNVERLLTFAVRTENSFSFRAEVCAAALLHMLPDSLCSGCKHVKGVYFPSVFSFRASKTTWVCCCRLPGSFFFFFLLLLSYPSVTDKRTNHLIQTRWLSRSASGPSPYKASVASPHPQTWPPVECCAWYSPRARRLWGLQRAEIWSGPCLNMRFTMGVFCSALTAETPPIGEKSASAQLPAFLSFSGSQPFDWINFTIAFVFNLFMMINLSWL